MQRPKAQRHDATIRVQHGLPADLRTAAAALYWRHFGAQLLPLPTRHRRGMALVHAALRPEHALVALSPQGQLIGIAGLRDAQGGLLTADPRSFRAVWGNARGRLCHLSTGLYRAGPQTADLVIDGIAIRPDWRRCGIARALVEAAARHARARGHQALRAEVAAGNREALAAWRAMGFTRQSRERLGWLWSRPAHVLRLTL